AMEEYREVLENMAEATVETVKEMAEQTREVVGRIEGGQVVEVRARQIGEEERRERVADMTTTGLNFTQVACRAKHKDIVRRAKNKMKQMIIVNAKGNEGWKDLAEKALLEKAKIPKDLMGVQGLDTLKVEFFSARKLKNGGVLYKLNSTEAAEWLAKLDMWAAFLDNFGAGMTVKDRVYDIFMEFILVGLGNMLAEQMRVVENGNGLHPGELVAARWARAPQA
ncbi:hypothetical protein J132_08679, partial [Termitomyces sp. J132]